MNYSFAAKRLSVLFGFMLMLMVSIGASAGESESDFSNPSATISCAGNASFTVTINNTGDAEIELTIDNELVDSDSDSVESGDTKTFDFNFPAQTGESILFEFYGDLQPTEKSTAQARFESSKELILSQIVNCSDGGGESKPSDGRFCFEPGEARAAVYGFKDGDSYGIEIWAIDENDNGQRVIRMTAGEIEEKTVEGERTLLNSSIFSSVKLYRLEDGRFQINVGPVDELKVHVCIFNAIPPTEIEKSTFSY